MVSAHFGQHTFDFDSRHILYSSFYFSKKKKKKKLVSIQILLKKCAKCAIDHNFHQHILILDENGAKNSSTLSSTLLAHFFETVLLLYNVQPKISFAICGYILVTKFFHSP